MIYDKDIREPLFEFLEERYRKVRILEEKTIGKSRADVVMVTENELIGIEIKSDADTYARLSSQVRDYDAYYDRNIVVVGTSHALHIREHVPDYWGVITVELVNNQFDFYVLREASENPKMKWDNKISILWRPELAILQDYYQMPKYKEKSKRFVIEKILGRFPEKISPEDFSYKMNELLFERDYTTVQETLREYRKGEIRKKIEAETDLVRQLELMVENADKIRQGKALQKIKRRKRRK